MFGSGVIDVEVETKVRRGWLAHTEHWTPFGGVSARAAPTRLIAALDLSRIGLARPKQNPAPTAEAGTVPDRV